MGKQKRKEKKILPRVSVCTPTFNRRPFIESMIKCYEYQDYPKELLEWIIVDDGTDKIEDMVKDKDYIKYYPLDEKITLGKKRNLMHTKCSGDIIVYMDDDDYYPPCRISHAVEVLMKNPKALCAGSSEMYIYFKHIESMYKFGPYSPNHATAATFAFRKELLKISSYDETACLAEEKKFLKDYTIPFVQLDPLKTILVFSHNHNSFDKKRLLINADQRYCKLTSKTVSMFIKDKDLKEFYMNKIEDLLKDYEPGRPEHKPDVLKHLKLLEEEREKQQTNQMSGIRMQGQDGKIKNLTNKEVYESLNKMKEEILILKKEIIKRDEEILKLKNIYYNSNSINDSEIIKEINLEE